MEWDPQDGPGRNTDSGASKAAAGKEAESRGCSGLAAGTGPGRGKARADVSVSASACSTQWVEQRSSDFAAPAFWLVPECGGRGGAPAARGSPVHTAACARSLR